MDYQREYLSVEVKNKFYGHDKLKSKTVPLYPFAIERQYIKTVNAYMALYKKMLIKYLAQLKKAIITDRQLQKALRIDGQFEVNQLIDDLFKKMQKELQGKHETFGLRSKIEEMALLTKKLSVREWKKTVKNTLGIDIFEDYYLGEFYQAATKEWVDENVSLIVTIPQESLDDMKEIVKEGFTNGRTITDITKEVQRRYGINKRHARLIARDQLGKFYGRLAKMQQQDSGIEEYTWSTSLDSRVRSSHRHLEGKTCNWNVPPVVDERTGRTGHPGEDYQCRCIALPIFKKEGIKLPIKGGE